VLSRVAWGRHASQVLAATAERTLAIVDLRSPGVELGTGTNLAGEARDEIRLELARATVIDGEQGARAAMLLLALGRLLRSAQIAAAIDRARAMTREHTTSRKQFGRPLASFQLVGAHLAEMASHAALVEATLADAVRALDAGSPDPSTTSLALISAHAATVVGRSAHQCHGAIGVTREYQLHHFTRRLWSWRDEAGSERAWCRSLGSSALAAPAELWASTQPVGGDQ
jgi:acyl-CoA dehydrogenase